MTTVNKLSYIDRNGKWIRPLLIGLITFIAPFSFSLAGIQPPPYASFSFVIAAIALGFAGLGAAFTDTFSGVIARILIIGITGAVSLAYLTNYYGWY